MRKITKIFLVFVLLMMTTYRVQAQGSIYRASNAVLYPGDSFTIVVDSGQSDTVYYEFDFGNSNNSVVSGPGRYVSNSNDPNRMSFTFIANKAGTSTISISNDNSITNNDANPLSMGGNSVTVKVSERPKENNTGRPNDTGENTGQYNPDLPKGETDAEKAERLKKEAEAKEKAEAEAKKKEAEKLEKTPLIESIGIVSESVRLKGENVLNVETKYDTFDYKITLPRNVDAFKLDLKPTSKDVKLTYDQMYKLDSGHDKVQVKVLAEKGDIKQEFNLTINRYSDSDIVLAAEGGEYKLLVDSMIDEKLDKLGIKKVLVDKKKGDLYYYEYESLKFALTHDNNKIAHWFLANDKGDLSEELFVFIDSSNTPRFIVNSMLVDAGTLNGNKYQEQAFKLSDGIVALDESLQFNNKIMAWQYDETSMITHELLANALDEKNETGTDMLKYEMVYVNESGKIVSAFVNFDVVDQNMMYLAMILGGAFVLVLIIFIVYWRATNKKINKFLARESL